MISESQQMGTSEERRRWFAIAVLFAAGLSPLSGCGDDEGIGQRYSVSGTVTYNGKPLEKGTINFQAVATDGRSASGEIQDGAYRITTQSPGDGALPGKYRVSVTAKEVDMAKVEATSKKQGGTMPSKKELGRAFQQAKRLIPAKYESPATSGLEAEVKEESNTFEFTLTD